jgi:prepilin-type N-terminal cleavage/methylation domain-containing protein
MKSQQISKDKELALSERSESNGFTLMEVMVVIAIITGLFVMGSFVDLSVINRRSIASEQVTLVSVLQKARNQSMNNIYAKSHGVHIDTGEYILFKGTSYSPSDPANEKIAKNNSTVISGINDIVFEQLSGNPSVTGEIILNDGSITKTIKITANGLIDW